VPYYKHEVDIFHIKHRWAMAFLGKGYAFKMLQIWQEYATSSRDTGNRGDTGKISSEAMNAQLLTVSTTPGSQPQQRFKTAPGISPVLGFQVAGLVHAQSNITRYSDQFVGGERGKHLLLVHLAQAR
jgi:hypothetical protein